MRNYFASDSDAFVAYLTSYRTNAPGATVVVATSHPSSIHLSFVTRTLPAVVTLNVIPTKLSMVPLVIRVTGYTRLS